MGWLSSHTELLSKLWGARTPHPPPPGLNTGVPTLWHLPKPESNQAYWGLGDIWHHTILAHHASKTAPGRSSSGRLSKPSHGFGSLLVSFTSSSGCQSSR